MLYYLKKKKSEISQGLKKSVSLEPVSMKLD